MKKKLAILASAGLVAGLTGAANADVTIDLGDFSFNPAEGAAIEVDNLVGTLTNWSISFDYGGNGDASWSSDALFGVQGPNGNALEAGGFNQELNDIFGVSALANVGPVGDDTGDPGSFTNDFGGLTGHDVSGSGTWTLFVADGYDGGTELSEYSNVSMTLRGVDVIPAPGALALLGVAGLIGRRRRRN